MSEEQQAPGIQKTPVPTAIAWELVEMLDTEENVHHLAALSVATPVGSQTYFLDRQSLSDLHDGTGRLLAEMPLGVSKRSQLIVPEVDTAAVLKAVENGKGRKP